MHVPHEEDHLLRICRSAMPGVAGVVVSTPQGRVLAHERVRVADPRALARDALARQGLATPTSALVPRADGLYLVMFVPVASV